jgi:hypothetical protein
MRVVQMFHHLNIGGNRLWPLGAESATEIIEFEHFSALLPTSPIIFPRCRQQCGKVL